MVLQYASPSGRADEVAATISFLGSLIILIGVIFAFKKSKVEL